MDVALGNSSVEGFPNFPSNGSTAGAGAAGVAVGAAGGAGADPSQVAAILSARHTANSWLLSILQIPIVRNSTIMRQFLCYDANVVPVQFEGLAWIHFQDAAAAAGGVGGGGADAAAGGAAGGQSIIAGGAGGVGGVVASTNPSSAAAALSYAAVTARGTTSLPPPRPTSRTNLDEMEMEDMFTLDDEEDHDGNPNEDDDGRGDDGEEDDDDDVHSIASYENEDDDDDGDVKIDDDDDYDDDAEYLHGRYEPTDETLSPAEVMEIQQDTVEMVEDVGSLAQSLGASHLGRSLNLQREFMAAAQARVVQAQQQQQQQAQQQHPDNMIGGGGNMLGGGIHIMDQGQHHSTTITAQGSSSSSTLPSVGEGGIGGAMAMAADLPQAAALSTQPHVQGLGDSFHRTAPVSAPKLDSFNMIKVIGKGSFGKCAVIRNNRLPTTVCHMWY